MRVRILFNPSSARGRGVVPLEMLEYAARDLGPVIATASGADLRAQARRAVAEGIDRLVVAGGDGSLHLAVQELAGADTALVPIASGRGNDLATCLGLRRPPEDLTEWVREGAVRRVDLGRAGDVWFGVHCGVGFDSEAARWANEQRLVGNVLSYPLAFFRTLATFVPPRIRVEYEGGVFDEEAMFVVCANCWRFGGGMKVAPAASIEDGLLDVVMVERVSKWVALGLLARVYSGRHVGHAAVRIVKTPWARIRLDRELEMYGDGERMLAVGTTPLEVRAHPGALRVVHPPVGGPSDVELDALRQR